MFSAGMVVTATFGEFAEELARADEAKRHGTEAKPKKLDLQPPEPDRRIVARALLPGGPKDFELRFIPRPPPRGSGQG